MDEQSERAFEGEAQLDVRDLLCSYLASFPNRLRLYAGLGVIIGMLLGLSEFFVSYDVKSALATVITLTLFMSFGAVLSVPLNAAISAFRLDENQKHCFYQIDSDGFRLRDAAGTSAGINWHQVSGAKCTNSAIQLRIRNGMRWIPLRAFKEDEHSGLTDFIARQIELKP